MASRVHQVTKYQYSFDARAGGAGQLHLWGDAGQIAVVRFVHGASTIPAPIVAPDLKSATMWCRRSALAGLIDLLRNQQPVGVRIDDQGGVDVLKVHGLADSLVVCSVCSPGLLAAKTGGIIEAMRRLVAYCGADARADICPVTFHLNGDSVCGAYTSGVTGSFSLDPQGRGQVCLFDVEKENRALPFTAENAQLIEDQLLPVHEAMHAWFVGRQENYRIQEPFCKWVSFVISESPGGPDYCSRFSSTPDGHPDVLMKHLCGVGITTPLVAQVLTQTASAAANKGDALTDLEFTNVVTTMIGKDAAPAFQLAGILP